MKNLDEKEILLKGKIFFNKTKNVFELDEVGKRIEYLIANFLIKVDSDESGWFVLYKNPIDNKYWELSYPDSELEGGGAPTLRVIDLDSPEMIKYHI